MMICVCVLHSKTLMVETRGWEEKLWSARTLPLKRMFCELNYELLSKDVIGNKMKIDSITRETSKTNIRCSRSIAMCDN